MTENFTSIPVVDFAQSQTPATKAAFLTDLRNALVKVGFFYLKNPPIPQDVEGEFIRKSIEFFDLPNEKKLDVDIMHSRHFLGYTQVASEQHTGGATDYRETYTLGMDTPAPGPDQPEYLNLDGPNIWPDETAIPGFREAIKNYQSAMALISDEFKVFVAEALDLEPTALLEFCDCTNERLKLAKYPPPSSDAESQGIGAHKDSSFLTFLLQATQHSGLEAQNKSGAWIPVPPMPGTLVVNNGRMLESMTGGICKAATHRVTLRKEDFIDANGASLGPRYSFPFFKLLRFDLAFKDMVVNIPAHIADMARDEPANSAAEGFLQPFFDRCLGDGLFRARALANVDAARKWYPDVLADTLRAQQTAQA